MMRLILLAFTLAFAGCATTHPLLPAATSVQLNPDVSTSACTFLGVVVGRESGAVTRQALRQSALNDLRNRAAAMHATMILRILVEISGDSAAPHAIATGAAYRCTQCQGPTRQSACMRASR